MQFQIDYKSLYDELERLEITVYDYDLQTCNALTVLVNGKYYIGINKNKRFSEWMRFWLIEHELEHIKHGTFYHINDDKFIINKNERITNDALVTKLGLVIPVLEALMTGLDKWEICAEMQIPYEVFDCVVDFINRRGLSNMKNCVELLCHKNNMDALVLAKRLGCTEQEAKDIIDEKIVIKLEYIRRLCQIFSVEQEYLLCL